MRTSLIFGALSVVAASAAIGACSSSGSGSSTGTGGQTSSTTSSSTTSGTAGSGTTSSSTTSSSTTSSSTSTSTSTSTSSSTSSSGGTCMGLGDACTNCAFTSCENLYCTCFGDADCGPIVTCLNACAVGDTTCIDGCYAHHTTGISEATLLDACEAMSCAGMCGNAATLPKCEECLFTNAAANMDACLVDSTCIAWLACANACADPVCIGNCATDTDADAVNGAYQGVCSNECM
jgi:hypothetical protein